MIREDESLQQAFDALQHSYAPYSKFSVAACVQTKDGNFIVGVNIENASYGLTNCAERSALFSAYSQGYCKTDILAMAIVSKSDHIISPCGACRQVMIELLLPQTPIILANGIDICNITVSELLPFSFTRKDLT